MYVTRFYMISTTIVFSYFCVTFVTGEIYLWIGASKSKTFNNKSLKRALRVYPGMPLSNLSGIKKAMILVSIFIPILNILAFSLLMFLNSLLLGSINAVIEEKEGAGVFV